MDEAKGIDSLAELEPDAGASVLAALDRLTREAREAEEHIARLERIDAHAAKLGDTVELAPKLRKNARRRSRVPSHAHSREAARPMQILCWVASDAVCGPTEPSTVLQQCSPPCRSCKIRCRR